MSISEFNDFSMSNRSKIQWFFNDIFHFTNFNNFSWNSMIFPRSWNRSKFQWFFKSCGNPAHTSGKTLYWNRTLVYYHISQVQFPYSDWSVYDVTLLILVPSQLCCPPRRPVCIHSLIVGDSPPSLIGDRVAELRDHSRYGLSQWEKALLCNAFSHWSSPYPEWSLELNSGGS